MEGSAFGRKVTAVAVLALVGWLPVQAAGQPASDSVDAASVRGVVHEFHEALAAGDSARALELLHPEVRVFESGHPETLSEYRSGHLAADIEFSGSVDRRILDEQVSGTASRALYLSEYRMAGNFRGEEVDAHGVETIVLVRIADRWRIRHIHWSSQ